MVTAAGAADKLYCGCGSTATGAAGSSPLPDLPGATAERQMRVTHLWDPVSARI